MISVLVITYNQKKYIEKCLDSILSQDIDETIEVLVGDDCSTDGTSQLLLYYARLYPNVIKPILRERNIGATANIFDLIKRAKGRYICFCEGDDYWLNNNKIFLQLNFLDSNDDFASVVHRTDVVDEYNRKIIPNGINWIKYKEINELKDYDALQLPGHISSLFVRNHPVFRDSNNSLMLCDRNSSDKEIFLLTLSIGRMGFINEYLSAYRLVRNCSSNSVVANIYSSNTSRSLAEMRIIVSMEKWLLSKYKVRKYFIKAQSKWLLTAIFHKIKGYDLKVCDVWHLCTHKCLCLLYLPIAACMQIINKIRLVIKLDIR